MSLSNLASYILVRLEPVKSSALALAPSLTLKYKNRFAKLERDKGSSLFSLFESDEEKSFMTSTPGANVIKLFWSTINGFSY